MDFSLLLKLRGKILLKIYVTCESVNTSRNVQIMPNNLLQIYLKLFQKRLVLHLVDQIYFGLAEKSFKVRSWNRKKDFNHQQCRKNTKLSRIMRSLKEEQIMSRIRWSIVEEVYGKSKNNFCPLCLAEKVGLIEHFNDNRLLHKRNEFISGCRHQVKLLLKRFKRR